MSSKKDHLAKAEHDERFVEFVGSASPFLDWAITATFYAALHYVEAYFASVGRHSPDHRARDSSIRRDPKISSIYDDYSELKNHSVNARYYMHRFRSEDLDVTLKPHLEAIKTHIKRLL